MTRNDVVARLRDAIKEQTDDSKYTNRYLWSTFNTFMYQLIKQETDKGRIYNESELWISICVEMEEVSALICDCLYIPYDCTVYRSKYEIPLVLTSSSGPVYRFLATPDLSRNFVIVSPYEYSVKSKIRYNPTKYAFIHNKRLYTPKDTYPLLSFNAIFEGDTSLFNCGTETTEGSDTCFSALNLKVNSPSYLIDAGIKMALSELLPSTQITPDEVTNVNSIKLNAQ